MYRDRQNKELMELKPQVTISAFIFDYSQGKLILCKENIEKSSVYLNENV